MKSVIPEAWKEHDKRVRPYQLRKRLLSWSSTLVTLVALGYLLIQGHLTAFEELVEREFGLGWVGWMIFFAGLGLLLKFLGFAFAFGDYRVEKKFHLSRQTPLAWLKDDLKGMLVGGVLGGVALTLVWLCIVGFGRQWWIPSCIGLLVFSVLLAQLAPVLLIPIFFKLKPMAPTPLKERLLKMCSDRGVDVKDVYHLGLGEKTEKGNAAFVGLGKTKRILIGDTLYEKFLEEEVEAVFAHELGHQVHNDLWRGLGLAAFLLVVGFAIAQWICHEILFDMVGTEIHRPLGLLWFMVVLSLVQKPASFFQVLFSRRQERAADSFAQHEIGRGASLADALEKLTYQNFGYFKPPSWVEFFTYSHPAPWRRILGIRGK